MSNRPTDNGTLGAAYGAMAALALPFVVLAISQVTYKGGGANIGAGFLFFALPVLVPMGMKLGRAIGKRRSQNDDR